LSWQHSPLYDHESRGGGVSKFNSNITNHLSYAHKYSPKWQYEEQEQELTGKKAHRLDKPIIMIGSCERDRNNGYNDSIRNTWAKAWKHLIDYRFVLGKTCSNPKPDEIIVHSGDGYYDLPFKTREGHRWALDNGYDYVFQCFTDTYIIVPRLLKTDFRRYDCTGHMINHNGSSTNKCLCGCDKSTGEYPQGGAGYWLSPKASKVLIADTPGHPDDFWMSEDLWVGNALRRGGITNWCHEHRYWACNYPHTEKLFSKCRCGRRVWEDNDSIGGVVSVHLSYGTNNYDVSWMYETHHKVLKHFSAELEAKTQPGSDEYLERYPEGAKQLGDIKRVVRAGSQPPQPHAVSRFTVQKPKLRVSSDFRPVKSFGRHPLRGK
jgi:hypothetical protein